VEQIFGVEHWDWWEIYAKNPDMDSRVPIRVLARMSPHWCTKEEEHEARAAHFAGKKHPDPGESGKNARFMAAVNPAVIQRIMSAVLVRLAELKKAQAERDWLTSDRAASKGCVTCPSIRPRGISCQDALPGETTPCKCCWDAAARQAVEMENHAVSR